MSMHQYFCYGLHIRSEMPLPELRTFRGERTDVTIRYGDVGPPAQEEGTWGSRTIREEPDAITLWMDQVGGIEARRGRVLTISPCEGAEERGFRFLVSGIGLGLILHQRGTPALHASAAVVDDGVVGFIGGKGMGKSTTAASFHNEGYPVVTDDVLPYRIQSDEVRVLPAFPNLKLYSDSVEAVFGEDPDNCPRVDPRGDKRTRDVERFADDALPLRCLYVLDWAENGAKMKGGKVAGQKACLELLRNSFALRILEKEGSTSEELNRVSQLSKRVPIRRLVRPRDLSKADQVPTFVERDLRTLTSSVTE